MVVPNIISGFDQDCNILFIKFEKLSTVRYAAFSKIWREMNFSLVFSGRRVKELICFTTEALCYIKFFFMQTNSFLRKICALYIMYGIYFKQPIRYSSKIILTLDEWKEVKDFIIELKENDHTDALVILLTLVFENAFEFSATNSIRFNAIPCKGLIHTNDSKINDFENFGLQNIMNDLKRVEKEYCNVKRKILESGTVADLKFSCLDFNQSLQDILEGNVATSTPSTEESVPGTSKQMSEEDVGIKRKSIREKSFRKKNKSMLYRSSVIEKTEMNSSDNSE